MTISKKFRDGSEVKKRVSEAQKCIKKTVRSKKKSTQKPKRDFEYQKLKKLIRKLRNIKNHSREVLTRPQGSEAQLTQKLKDSDSKV